MVSVDTDGTWSTRRFSTTTRTDFASVRMAASDIRDEVSTTPSTTGTRRSSASSSVPGDSWLSAITMVWPACRAVRSAPLIMPKKTGLVMSATTIASREVVVSGSDRSVSDVR